ncbi:DEKNAAC102601 [Brettanomyces naardenensis]|uniref:DEKNAAC102601 n=1 Tax=Brettanomyces naardenensis TaxID=13370 RepID=A0A448YL23_BRENA|nr:DEKNAAC102601 [Brettanomyces naardenensis]
MPTVFINNAALEYSIIGPASGPLVITLHGGRGFGSKESDFKVYSGLAGYGYRVVSFDFRGHGNSSITGPFTFSQLVEDIEGIRKQFSLSESSKCILIGGSFGGFLAQQYALTYPDHLSHLILRGTAPSYHHEEEAFREMKKRMWKIPNGSISMLKKVFTKFESDEEMRLIMYTLAPLYSETYDSDLGLKKCLHTKYYSETHNQLYSENEKYFDYRDQLPQLRVRTLIFDGEQDWICPTTQSEELHRLIPNSELKIIPKANHSVHLEFPHLVVEMIYTFLSRRL